MKKLFTILTAAVMLLSGFTFATDSDKVNARVKAAFRNDFSSISEASWEKTSDFYFAKFTINKMEVTAAYNEQGELIGTSKTMESSQLPISVSLALAKKYEGYVVTRNALELTFEGDTRYYVTVVNDRKILKLKCSANGFIEVERRTRRK